MDPETGIQHHRAFSVAITARFRVRLPRRLSYPPAATPRYVSCTFAPEDSTWGLSQHAKQSHMKPPSGPVVERPGSTRLAQLRSSYNLPEDTYIWRDDSWAYLEQLRTQEPGFDAACTLAEWCGIAALPAENPMSGSSIREPFGTFIQAHDDWKWLVVSTIGVDEPTPDYSTRFARDVAATLSSGSVEHHLCGGAWDYSEPGYVLRFA